VRGVPAIFAAELFADLLQLRGDKGAKSIIARYKDQSHFVSMPEAALDIDTLRDLEKATAESP
jgi:molybdenum cofactor cytidylyltransferase